MVLFLCIFFAHKVDEKKIHQWKLETKKHGEMGGENFKSSIKY